MYKLESEFIEINKIVIEILKEKKSKDLNELLTNSSIKIIQSDYDNWNGGTYLFTIYITIDVSMFVRFREHIDTFESELLSTFRDATRDYDNETISKITIAPKSATQIDWGSIDGFITKEQLLNEIKKIKNTLISVSTGGERIKDVNEEYKRRFKVVEQALHKLLIRNPNSHTDLWDWYGKWSSSFPKYIERRTYVNEMYNSLIEIFEESDQSNLTPITVDLTNWERVERSIDQIRLRQNEAINEEQFQVVGLLCRDTLITLAQAVFDHEKHNIEEAKYSNTDAKKMLDAYITSELSGSSNENLRRLAKSTLDFANELTHKRTACKKDGVLCANATISIINIIGAIEDRI